MWCVSEEERWKLGGRGLQIVFLNLSMLCLTWHVTVFVYVFLSHVLCVVRFSSYHAIIQRLDYILFFPFFWGGGGACGQFGW